MIKKWSYVAAAMLTVASGLALTSCIDNDEPYGITQIRVATANLLEAKKAALAAESAANEVRLELDRLEIEIKKAEAERQRLLAEAEVKIKEAEAKAKELQAQADAALTEAEAAVKKAEADKAQAEADKIKAETEALIASEKAALDEMIAQAEIRVNQSQLAYDRALYNFEQQKIKDAALANDNLYQAWSDAFQAYLDQLDTVNDLNKDLLYAQREYALAAIDLVPDGNGGWTSDKYDALKTLQNTVADLQNEIAEQNELIDFYNQHIDELKSFTSSDELYKLFEKYSAEKEANLKALADANVELAALAVENKDLYDSRKKLEADVLAYGNDVKEDIQAYTWEPDKALAAIGLSDPVEVVGEGQSYTLNDNTPYFDAMWGYDNLIDELKSYLLDENDIAWTNVRINVMTREYDNAVNIFTDAETAWTNAKNAYNKGNEPKFDLIPLEGKAKAALDAYNAEAGKCASLRQDVLDAQEIVESTRETMNAESKALQENPASLANQIIAIGKAHDKAYEDAQDTRDAAEAKADADYTKAVKAADKDLQTALQKQEDADIAVREAKANGASAAKIAELEDAFSKAAQEYIGQITKTNQAKREAATAKQKAYSIAAVAYDKAILAADRTYNKDREAWVEAGGGADLAKDPAAAAFLTAEKNYNDAQVKLNEAWQAVSDNGQGSVWDEFWKLETAFRNQAEAIGNGWTYDKIWDDIYNKLDGFLTGSVNDTEFPTTILPSHYTNDELVYYNVKQYLINTSIDAYGQLGVSYDYDRPSPWDIDEAFVVDKVTKEMVDAYLAEVLPGVDEFAYPYWYNLWFGAYGKTLYLKNRIDVAKAMVDNQKLLSDAIEPLQENINTLLEQDQKLQAGLDELIAQKNEVDAKIEDLEADAHAKIEELEHWNRVYGWVLSDITANIGMLDQDLKGDGNDLISDIIENLKISAEEEIAVCNNRIEGLNELLARAQYQLDQYVNNEGTLNENPVTVKVEHIEAQLNAAKEKLEYLKNRADELQAKYEAANK